MQEEKNNKSLTITINNYLNQLHSQKLVREKYQISISTDSSVQLIQVKDGQHMEIGLLEKILEANKDIGKFLMAKISELQGRASRDNEEISSSDDDDYENYRDSESTGSSFSSLDDFEDAQQENDDANSSWFTVDSQETLSDEDKPKETDQKYSRLNESDEEWETNEDETDHDSDWTDIE